MKKHFLSSILFSLSRHSYSYAVLIGLGVSASLLFSNYSFAECGPNGCGASKAPVSHPVETRNTILGSVSDVMKQTNELWKEKPRPIEESIQDWHNDSRVGVGLKEKMPAGGVGFKRDESKVNWENFHTCFNPQLIVNEKDDKAPLSGKGGAYNNKRDKVIGGAKEKKSEETPRCTYCQPKKIYKTEKDCEDNKPLPNHGEVWEYLWPEWQIEINDFGVAAINPAVFDRPDLQYSNLFQNKDKYLGIGEKYYQQTSEKLSNSAARGLAVNLGAEPGQVGIPFGAGFGSNSKDSNDTERSEGHLYATKLVADNHTKKEDRLKFGKDDSYWYRELNSKETKCLKAKFWYNGYIFGHDNKDQKPFTPSSGDSSAANSGTTVAKQKSLATGDILAKEFSMKSAPAAGGSDYKVPNDNGQRCFGDTLPDKKDSVNSQYLAMWTEDPRFYAWAHNPNLSKLLNPYAYQKMQGPSGSCSGGGCSGGSKKGGGGGMKLPFKIPGMGKGKGGGGAGGGKGNNNDYRSSSSLYSSSSSFYSSESSFSSELSSESQSSVLSSSSALSSSSNSLSSSVSSFSSSSSSSAQACLFGDRTCFLNSSASASSVRAFLFKADKKLANTAVKTKSLMKTLSAGSANPTDALVTDSAALPKEQTIDDYGEIDVCLACRMGRPLANRMTAGLGDMMGVQARNDEFCSRYCFDDAFQLIPYNLDSAYPSHPNVQGMAFGRIGYELAQMMSAKKNSFAAANMKRHMQTLNAKGLNLKSLAPGVDSTMQKGGLPYFTDAAPGGGQEQIDKIQLVYPTVTGCMSMFGDKATNDKAALEANNQVQDHVTPFIYDRGIRPYVPGMTPDQIQETGAYGPNLQLNNQTVVHIIGASCGTSDEYIHQQIMNGSDGNWIMFPWTKFNTGNFLEGVPITRDISWLNNYLGAFEQSNLQPSDFQKSLNSFVNQFSDDLAGQADDPGMNGSRRMLIWNRRTACTCQYRSVVANNEESDMFKKIDEFLKKQDETDGLYKGNLYSIKDDKNDSGEGKKEIQDQKGDDNVKWIKCLGDPKESNESCKELKVSATEQDKGTGCQAYDGMDKPKTKDGKKEGRGQGNQNPDPDYKAEPDDKDERFACSAYQAYPFNMGEHQEGVQGEKSDKCRERFEEDKK
ncbi:MAG: hypothetical protein IT292_03950 [Deltaproteobacteria bacterium]|nr:hypothetical protein [Deltaproteobacteria bacterium]